MQSGWGLFLPSPESQECCQTCSFFCEKGSKVSELGFCSASFPLILELRKKCGRRGLGGGNPAKGEKERGIHHHHHHLVNSMTPEASPIILISRSGCWLKRNLADSSLSSMFVFVYIYIWL